MSRKQQLISALNKALDYDNYGSFKSRQHRRFVLMKLIHDLYETGIVPANFYMITTENIQALVQFWQHQGIKTASIMNYLVCLRYFFKKIGHNITGIDNRSLNLSKARQKIKPLIDADFLLNAVSDPLAHLLVGLQVKFGLSFQESIRLNPQIHLQDDALYLTREITINHKDRLVPIITPVQQELIQQLNQLTKQQASLNSIFEEKFLRLALRVALMTLQLPSHINYRFLYAKARLVDLCADYSLSESRKMVIAETAINQTSSVWRETA